MSPHFGASRKGRVVMSLDRWVSLDFPILTHTFFILADHAFIVFKDASFATVLIYFLLETRFAQLYDTAGTFESICCTMFAAQC